MKILELTMFPLYGNGSSTYARKLAEGLIKLKHDVAIVAVDNRKLKKIKTFEVKLPFFVAIWSHSEHPNSKKYCELKPKELNKTLYNFYKTILETVEKYKPDIIYVHHAAHLTWIANYIKAIYGIPYIVISHGTDILNVTLDKRYLPLTKDALSRAKNIICVSGDTKRWFLKVFSKKFQDKIRIIPGGVDLNAYKHSGSTKNIDSKYKLKGKKVVIFAGRVTESKGIQYLVKAAGRINAEIFILGSGDYSRELESLAKKEKLNNIHFIAYFGPKYVKELREFYRRADVFVCPSIWDEPLGLVVLEAMASGTPVVGSRKGGIPLAIKNNYNGFLVRARSAREITEAVNKILNNQELKKSMSTAARKTVETKFDWNDIAKRFEYLSRIEIKSHKTSDEGMRKKFSSIDIKKEKTDLHGKKLDYI